MEYDKNICLNNIYKLVKEKNLKLGELENKVGVSVGYFSKLLKEGNKASPSIEVLSKIGDLLNISLDKLCKTDLSKMGDSEFYVFSFLSSLLKRTREGEFIWVCENEKELNDLNLNSIECKSKKLFYFAEVPYRSEIEYPEYHTRVVFKSAFRRGEQLEAENNSYYLDLPNGTTVFMMMIRRINNGLNYDINEDVDIEVYIQKGDDISPVARFQSKEDIIFDNIVYELFIAAGQSAKHCLLNQNAKDAIDEYMKNEEK